MSSVVISGDTSGSITIAAPAVAGTYTQTLPQITGTLGTLNRETVQTTTSGTSKDFTVPSNVIRVTVILNGVSTSGTSPLIVQLGDSGGIETTGYLSTSGNIATSTASVTSATNGFIVSDISSASNATSGIATIVNISSNSWVCSGASKQLTTGVTYFAGDKALTAELLTVRITTVNGTDTFDAGSINILYE